MHMFRWRHKPPCVRTGVDAPDGSAPQPGPASRGALKAVVCTDGPSARAGWGAAVRWGGAHFCPKRCETETHLPSLCPPPLPLWKALRRAPWAGFGTRSLPVDDPSGPLSSVLRESQGTQLGYFSTKRRVLATVLQGPGVEMIL